MLAGHKQLRACGEFGVSAFVSPARALPLRALMGRGDVERRRPAAPHNPPLPRQRNWRELWHGGGRDASREGKAEEGVTQRTRGPEGKGKQGEAVVVVSSL